MTRATIFESIGPGHSSAPGELADYGLGPTAPLPLPLGPSTVTATEASWPIVFEEDPMPREVARVAEFIAGDTSSKVFLCRSNGSAIDLATVSGISLKLKNIVTGALQTITIPVANIIDTDDGTIRWAPTTGQAASASHWATLVLTFSDATVKPLPNSGAVLFVFAEALAAVA